MTTRSAALDAAAQAAADTWAELWRDVQASGTQAVAERCMFPGRDAARIELRLRQIKDKPRKGIAA